MTTTATSTPTTDLIGRPLAPHEQQLLAAYRSLTAILAIPDLAPTTRANVLDALAALGVAVTSLGLAFEHLTTWDA